jgi:hypothetical protein
MEASSTQKKVYTVPTYQAEPGAVWYHFLHGNVPGHQIDFIYRPEVPQGPLRQQIFGHLTRLVKYIEPRPGSAYAFAIGNLSRDDTQYEPGHGALALIFGLRIQGVMDHAGRRDPPFCHAIAAVDRQLDTATLLDTSLTFYQNLLPDESSHSLGSQWYHRYVRHDQSTDALQPVLRDYVAGFKELPAPPPSTMGLRWTVEESTTTPSRIVIVHAAEEPFESIAGCAARIAGVLVESDIRWTTISSGREADVPGGVSVRFVPEREASSEKEKVPLFRIEDIPHDPADIAGQLFGAREARASYLADPRVGLHHRYGAQPPLTEAQRERQSVSPSGMRASGRHSAPNGAVEVAVEAVDNRARSSANRDSGAVTGATKNVDAPKALGDGKESIPERGAPKKSRNQFGLLIGIAAALAIGGAVAAVVIGMRTSAETNAGSPASSAAGSALSASATNVPSSATSASQQTNTNLAAPATSAQPFSTAQETVSAAPSGSAGQPAGALSGEAGAKASEDKKNNKRPGKNPSAAASATAGFKIFEFRK